ncbi:MAG: hypothetical protein ACT4O9_13840 [Blastocatellia bacterium]
MNQVAYAIMVLVLVVCTHAQTSQFPNELTGYQLFGNGKLKTVGFETTKNQDIEKLFGDDCEKGCDFDERFSIKFDYLDLGDCMTTQKVRDRVQCPLDRYIGTIESISLIPKKEIIFHPVSTNPFTNRSSGGIFAKDGSSQVFYESFGDEFGLKYSFRRESSKTTFPGPEYMEGMLYSIEYVLSDQRIEKIFQAPFKPVK